MYDFMIEVRSPFSGPVPTAICRDLSEKDCNLLVEGDAETCPAGHVLLGRIIDDFAEAEPAAAQAVKGEHLRLFRQKSLDIAEASLKERAAFLLDNVNLLYISKYAFYAFKDHHGVDEERVRLELRYLVRKALEEGRYGIAKSGFWHLTYEGFSASLNPSATTMTKYKTAHFERMPSEVASKAKSRFRKRRKGRVVDAAGQELAEEFFEITYSSYEELRSKLLSKPVFTQWMVASWAKRNQLSFTDAAADIAEKFVSDLAEAKFEENKDEAKFVLHRGNQHWVVSNFGGVVISTYID